ncbi:Kinesin light chain [Seminavis robusta]|uniref:Kinesin light chain n=1 Tax=Seminavis robusta TaxID=568900 RepID=A0A9N8D9S9_9STRA|nr:Kinesin light chain [Seminavis robusta]|eukprot:Sro44_g026670.1 Kinesin light chain (718) ;mRNA; f:110516-112862
MDATQTEGSVERVPQETLIDMIQSDERGALTIGTLHDIILSQDGENKLTLQDVFDRLGGSGSSSSEEHRQFSSQTATMATQQMAESAFCSLRERNDLTPEDQSSNKASDKEKLDNPLSFAKSSPERADETADVAPLPESATPAQSDCVAIVTPHEHDVLCCGGRGDFVKQHHAGNQNETKANGRMLCSQGGISIARAKMSGPSIPSITSCSTSMFVEPSKPVSSHITTGPMEMIADLNNMGVELVDSSELHEATQLFRRALSKANDMAFFAGSSARSPIGENSDASKNLYIYQRGEYDEGMHTFSQPIMIDAELASIHTSVATILYNLGQVAICTNNNQEACTSFLRALQIFQCGSDCCANSMKALSHAGGVTVVAILSNIGNVLYRAGRFEEAIQTFQKALEALAYYKESLRIRRNVLGQDAATKEVATTMNNIGRFHYKKGDLDQALRIYSEALTMRHQLFGDDHLDIAAVCYNMGQTLHQKGRLDDAMELYSGFLKIARKRLGCNHRDVVIMLKCIAQIHHERSEFEQACKLYREALQVGEAALGMNHPEIASTLNKLGNLLYKSGDAEGAIRVYKEGLKVERAVLSSCHPNIVVTLTNIGEIHKLRGEYHDALRVYKEAVQIQQRNRESSTTDIAATLSAIALIHSQASARELATGDARAQWLFAGPGPPGLDLLESTQLQVLLLGHQQVPQTHSYSKALEVYQEALRIRRDA